MKNINFCLKWLFFGFAKSEFLRKSPIGVFFKSQN